MTVAATTRKAGPFTGDGINAAFPFTFKVFSESDLLVVQTDLAGVESTLALTSQYTVTLNPDQDDVPGGVVTVLTAPATGYLITLGSSVPLSQNTLLTNTGGFYPTVINDMLDRVTILVQQLSEKVGRSLSLPFSAPAGTSLTLPLPESNQLIGWNADGDGLQNMDPGTLATIVAFGTAQPDLFSGDGATKNFGLTYNPGALGNLDVAVGGVTQRPGIDYTWPGGTVLSFVSAPPSGTSNILARYIRGLPQGYSDAAATTAVDGSGGSLFTTVQGFITKILSSAGSSIVGFIHTGTGAATRAVQSKLRDVVSIADFIPASEMAAILAGSSTYDCSAAALLALNSHKSVSIPSEGRFYWATQLEIPSAGQSIIGFGGTIVRAASLAGNSCIHAVSKNMLSFSGLKFEVATGQTHVQTGQFITLDTCHECTVSNCLFDAEIKAAGSNKESLFSALNTPSCNRLLVSGNTFRYLYGNCCGAHDGVGDGVNGKGVTVSGNVFYNNVDTGVGCWTNASNVSITGNVFERNDYSTSYNGVHIDIAGASFVSVTGNTFRGNTIGVRMLSNLGYTNNGNVIEGNTFDSQATGLSEPATCIKIAHYTNGATSNNEDVIIRSNTFKVKVWGINAASTVTDTSKYLTLQVDGNKFDISEPSCTGVYLQRLNPNGAMMLVPGSNVFTGAGAGAVPVGGNGPGTISHIISQQNTAAYRSNFTFTGTTAQNLASFSADRGLYSLAASVGTCTDAGGVGGTLQFKVLNGAALTAMYGFDQIVSAALSNTKWDNFYYVVPTSQDHEIRFTPHPSGNTDAYYYLAVVRLI